MKKNYTTSKQLFAQELEQKRKELIGRLDGIPAGSDSLAAWFLGPKAENARLLKELINRAMDAHCEDRKALYPNDPVYVTEAMKQTEEYQETVGVLKGKLELLLQELKGSVPFWSYRWQSHMNWDNTLPAVAAYFGTMLYNPNNVAAEASPVTTILEMQASNEICEMLGYRTTDSEWPSDEPVSWGHITCDGSIANNEAMWAARNLKYYPVSLAEGIKLVPQLQGLNDMKVNLADGSVKTIGSMNSWELLNLPADEILDLPSRIEKDYDINTDELTAYLQNYSIQNVGFDGINDYLDINIQRPVVMAPSDCHYSWPKSAAVLGIGANNLKKIFVDLDARMRVDLLSQSLQKALDSKTPILMVVAVIGSTEESAVDPLKDILALRETFRKKGLDFIVHCDAAWGGYFASILRKPKKARTNLLRFTPSLSMNAYVTEQYQHLHQADSITIDPHKAGYIPYAAGGLCYRNGAMRNLVAFTAPVVYHGGVDPTVGVYGLEGSKPGAAPAAVYLSQQVIPLDETGYGQILGKCMFNSKRLYSSFITMAEEEDPFIIVPFQRLPAEKKGESPEKIQEQYDFIKNEIVPKTNAEIMANPEVRALFPELGSDQVIITYTFNFKVDGQLNTDVQKLNELNLNIFKALSLAPGNDRPAQTPMYLTQSQFTVEAYGKYLVDHYKSRLGLSLDNDEPVNILISTTMDPWLTDTAEGNFIPEVTKALKETVLEQIELLVGQQVYH